VVGQESSPQVGGDADIGHRVVAVFEDLKVQLWIPAPQHACWCVHVAEDGVLAEHHVHTASSGSARVWRTSATRTTTAWSASRHKEAGEARATSG
jgi:hypothetical protein